VILLHSLKSVCTIETSEDFSLKIILFLVTHGSHITKHGSALKYLTIESECHTSKQCTKDALSTVPNNLNLHIPPATPF
jgi:hypothetical protein